MFAQITIPELPRRPPLHIVNIGVQLLLPSDASRGGRTQYPVRVDWLDTWDLRSTESHVFLLVQWAGASLRQTQDVPGWLLLRHDFFLSLRHSWLYSE